MPQPTGRTLPLSPPRRFIADLVGLAGEVPRAALERRMSLGEVAAARAAASPRPSWCAVFTKAYAVVAARRPELRRAYVAFPRPHLYEHPVNVAAVAVERRVGDEDAVLFAHVRRPEAQTLGFIDAHLRRCKEEPVESIGLFRRILAVGRLPTPLRRLAWWVGYRSSGLRRARHLGTFGVSVVSCYGAHALGLTSPLTTALDYGVIDGDGGVTVRLTLDHRVLDGAAAARALAEVEQVLKTTVLAELRRMGGAPRREDGPMTKLFKAWRAGAVPQESAAGGPAVGHA
jgi:hypothetical protein